MPNPIMQAIQSPRIQQIKDTLSLIKNAGNPQVLVEQMLNQNPQVKGILAQNNNDPKKAFYSMANQMGINPDEILSMLK